MSKLVVFTLLGGDLNQGFSVVTAQLWHHNQDFKITGSLPAAPELNKLYQRWQLLYEAVHQRLGNRQRIRVNREDITNVSINDFDEVCQQLQASLSNWLKFESFQNMERQLRTLLSWDDEIRIIIETNVAVLHSLPWHLWDFFDDYPKAELGLSNHEYASSQVFPKSSTGKVKILAILGNKVGIDIDKDSHLLQNLTDTQTTFLIEPTRKELDEQLWNYDWDILFFAGHSASEADGEIGRIYINKTDSLTISQFKNALKKAISRGLNIAIFNSCDGIGLARNLAELNIPQMIVMRTGVPDFVAQEFLKNFLIAFADAKPLYLAVREARERLQGLENDFPCASWLPVIYQNPIAVPNTWQELRDNKSETKSVDRVWAKNKISFPESKVFTVLVNTFILFISTITVRYLGDFEKVETAHKGFKSVYTTLNLEQCKTLETDRESSETLRCEGYQGIPLYVTEVDGRFDVDVGIPNSKWITPTPFNYLGDTVEWRIFNNKPIAVIMRYHMETVSIPNHRSSDLAVFLIGKKGSPGCPMAWVSANAQPDQNTAARYIADKRAKSFTCDSAKPIRL